MKRSLVLALAIMASGCASQSIRPISSASLSVMHDSRLPAPMRNGQPISSNEYVIGPYDKLTVNVFGFPDLSVEEIQVDGGGDVSLPLAGRVHAGGKTPAALTDEIAAALRRKFVRDPAVSVNLTAAVSQVVTVDGQVGQPGNYPVTGHMTLMRAVAAAKGMTEFAKATDVVILREVGDKRWAGLYNLAAIQAGAYEDPVIYPDDVVIVGDSPTRRLFKDFVSVTPLLAAPLIALLQNN